MSDRDLPQESGVRALVFDVFGTVVDWRTSVIRELTKVGDENGIPRMDWAEFADEWREGYGTACRDLSRGVGKWRIVDKIHRDKLEDLIYEHGIATWLSDSDLNHMNHIWHRLDGWPDASSGLTRLKSKHIIATLSNGNLGLLVNMARHARLPWDAIFGADVVGAYKPNPRVYSTACQMLGLPNDQVMMVAAHSGDLHAAANLGLRTAFVHRPAEHGGPEDSPMPEFATEFDYAASDLNDLADQFGCE